MSADPSTLQPPRHTGTQCKVMVEQGMLAYPCSLIQGHYDPAAEDPEPHYAIEVGRSVRAWQAWAAREQERIDNPVLTTQATDVIGKCPNCLGDLVAALTATGEPGAHCVDPECPIGIISIASGHGAPTQTIEDVLADVPEGFEVAPIGVEAGDEATLPESQIPEWLDVLPGSPTPTATEMAGCREAYDQAVNDFKMKNVKVHFDRGHAGVTAVHGGGSAETHVEMPQPTKQREGDQRIPDGDESQPDDFQRYIADLAGRRAIGIERYGQAHRPFNGRNTLLDAYEETLDHGLYLRSLLTQAEADRERLIEVVTKALYPILEENDPTVDEAYLARFAETAVDRIMGWVVSRNLTDEQMQSVTLDAMHASIHESVTYEEMAAKVVAELRAAMGLPTWLTG